MIDSRGAHRGTGEGRRVLIEILFGDQCSPSALVHNPLCIQGVSF